MLHGLLLDEQIDALDEKAKKAESLQKACDISLAALYASAIKNGSTYGIEVLVTDTENKRRYAIGDQSEVINEKPNLVEQREAIEKEARNAE